MKTQSINFLSAVLVAISVMLLSGNMAAAADLFGSNGVTRCVYKFTPDGTQSTFLSNRSFPTGLAFDSNGNLYEAEPGNDTIYKFTPDGTQSTFGTVSLFVQNLACDSSGNLYALASNDIVDNSGVIYKFAPNGSLSTFASGLSVQLGGLAIDADQNVYVGDYGNKSIYKYASDGSRSTFATGVLPFDLAVDAGGNLFDVDVTARGIYKFTPTGSRSTFASGYGFLAFNPNGTLFEASTETLAIYEFAPDGSRSTFATPTAYVDYLAFAVPEPTSIVLAALGFLGLASICRKRRN